MSPLFKKGISPAQIFLRRLGIDPDMFFSPEFLAMVEAKVALLKASEDAKALISKSVINDNDGGGA